VVLLVPLGQAVVEEEEGWLLATLMATAMSLATAMPLATAIPMALVALGGCQWLPEGAAWWLARVSGLPSVASAPVASTPLAITNQKGCAT
jgi:hypothetical protein